MTLPGTSCCFISLQGACLMSTMSFPSCSCLLFILLYVDYPLHPHVLMIRANQEDLKSSKKAPVVQFYSLFMICCIYETVLPFFYEI